MSADANPEGPLAALTSMGVANHATEALLPLVGQDRGTVTASAVGGLMEVSRAIQAGKPWVTDPEQAREALLELARRIVGPLGYAVVNHQERSDG